MGNAPTRLIPHGDMTAEQIVRCSLHARAVLHLCDQAAWAIENDPDNSHRVTLLADSVGAGIRLALELLEPIHDALESHEGLKGGAS